ncbi:hypothetical protein EDD11_005399 [Mortierella claussenii]|nr:hypothetical protein EDD11_005399 [Mortierella claussenii]
MPTTRARRADPPSASISKASNAASSNSVSQRSRARTQQSEVTVANENDYNNNSNSRQEEERGDHHQPTAHDSGAATRMVKATSTSSRQSRNRTTQSSSDVKENSQPLTARGARGARRAKAEDDTTKDEDVEEPRWQRVDAVVIPERMTRSKDKSLGAPKQRIVETLPKPWNSAEPAPLAQLETQTEKQVKTQGQMQSTEEDVQNTLLLSRLSLTPPPEPLLFDIEEEQDAVSENAHVAKTASTFPRSNASSQSLRNVPDLTLADLEPFELDEEGQMEQKTDETAGPLAFRLLEQTFGDDDNELDDEESDPFGFSKVNRQLQRTKDFWLKPLPINETHVSAPNAISFAVNTGSNDAESRSLTRRLDQTVMERAAARRRGDVKGKGKVVDRAVDFDNASVMKASSLKLDDEGQRVALDNGSPFLVWTGADTLQSDYVDGMDDDLQTAYQSSLGLNIENGEGCSTKPLAVALTRVAESTLASDPADDTADLDIMAPTSRAEDPPSTPETSSRRVSRLYGRSATPTQNEKETHDSAAQPINALSDSETEDYTLLEQVPSTPKKTGPTNTQLNSSPSSDELSSIILESTPRKKPEAGVPISLESSPTTIRYVRGQRSQFKKRKYALTEQLEALLPHHRKKRKTGGSRKDSKNTPHLVDSSDSSSDLEDEGDSDEVDFDEDDGVAVEIPVRRRSVRSKRPAPKVTRRTAGSPSKKRRVVAEAKAPMAKKHGHTAGKSTAGASSEKTINAKQEDRSGWTPSQYKAQEERIKYFHEVDDFELEVETC